MYRFNLKKILVQVMAIGLIGTVIYTIGINADAVEGNTKEVLPTFQVAVEGEPHREAWIGEEIEIKGTITPSEMDISNATTDIVLAIDVSKSMGDSAGIACTQPLIKFCTNCQSNVCKAEGQCKWEQKNCITHGVAWDGNGNPGIGDQCVIKRGTHTIKQNYCTAHKVSGIHDNGSTKLNELKSAIINFVDKNKINTKLNLSIVTYSKKATIKKEQYIESFNLSKDAEAIKNIVSNIQVESELGTNTGEAIRKANYLLGKSKSLSKKLILLTDGLPTYYSKNSTGEENTDISDVDPDDTTGFGGDGKNMTNATKGYAVNMGKNIKASGYEVVTISYGMSAADGSVIEEIHSSMSEDKTNYLRADGKTIKEAFTTVAAIIEDGYTTSPITLDLNLDEGNGLWAIQGGQVASDGVVRIAPITYNWVEAEKVYKAEPVDFQFSLIGTKKLQALNIFEKSQLIIQLGDMFIECKLPQYNVTINEQLPDIKAGYTDISPENPMVNENIEISYEVLLKEFDGSDLKEPLDTYIINNIRLKFDLGDKLLPVSNLEVEAEGASEYYLMVPEVTYKYEQESGLYKPEQERIEVRFQVKAKESGIIEFGSNNSMEYTGLGGIPIIKKLYTPFIYVEKADVMEHGLYGGAIQWYSNGADNYIYNLIEETKDKTFAKGSTLTMGAKFKLGDINSTLKLKVNEALKVVGNPTVYVQDKYGKLSMVGEMSSDTDEYSLAFNMNLNEELNLNPRSIMVVLYNIELPKEISEETKYENNIYLKGSSGNIRAAMTTTIISGKEGLPDLF